MMNTYKLNFGQIRQDPKLGTMLEALERGFEKFGVDFYLVGAVSRDVWMTGIHEIIPRRTTGDIDFAVYINEKGVYEALTEYLITQEGFRPYHENAFVLIYKDGTEVDLLPFGAIEDNDRRVTVQGTGHTSVHVDGFLEVYENSLPQVEIDNHTFKFCSLPGIVLLKMIAWEDRPEARRDDIIDISDVLDHYFEMHSNTIYENHADIFIDEHPQDATLTQLAARVMGREMKAITRRNEHLQTRIANLLEVNTTDSAKSRMADIIAQHFQCTVEDSLQLLQCLKLGLDEAQG